jgi:hypothetical protein
MPFDNHDKDIRGDRHISDSGAPSVADEHSVRSLPVVVEGLSCSPRKVVVSVVSASGTV